MTDYDVNIAKRELVAMPELYEFQYGGNYDYFTSFSEDLLFLGVTYKRATIERSGFSVDTEFGKIGMTIKTPVIDTLRTYIANQPVERTTVKVWRAVLDDLTEYRVIFSGDIQRVSFKGNVCQATCEMQSHILSQKLPNIVHQSFCNHQVFDDGCGLDWAAWRVSGSVSSIAADVYSVGAAAGYANGYFTGGQVLKDNDARYIINHSGSNLYLHVPFDSRVGIGTSVYLLPGCNGKVSTCKNKFNNFNNHLSMPYIPSTNPVMWGFK